MVIFQSALYALEEGGMTVSKVERKHFMAALSTVKPSPDNNSTQRMSDGTSVITSLNFVD